MHEVLLKLLILMYKVLPHKTPLLVILFFFFRVVAIKNYYPEIRIIIQLLQYMNKVRWKLSSFLLLILLPLIVMDAPKPWKLKANSLIWQREVKTGNMSAFLGHSFKEKHASDHYLVKRKLDEILVNAWLNTY